jgi:hypothetical protein
MNFSTLYLPGTIKDIRLYFRATTSSNSYLDMNYKKKIVVKQSYILLVWMNYLVNSFKDSQNKSTTGESTTLDNSKENSKIPAFFIYPRCNYKTTIQKAPMAHKTFSQEQFQFKFFYLVISLSINLSIKNFNIYSTNQLLFRIYSLRQKIPFVETNFFLLKSFSILLPFKSQKFLSI